MNARSRPFLLTLGLVGLLVAPARAQLPTTPAEWEPALGTLVRWPMNIPVELMVELARDDLLYVLAETPADESDALAYMTQFGTNLANVVFIRSTVFTEWTRDWGPISVFDASGPMEFVDAGFQGYPWVPGCPAPGAKPFVLDARRKGSSYADDDQVPAAVSAALGIPREPLDVLLTGGNFMTDGRGLAYSSQQMLGENAPLMDEATFRGRVQEKLGITDYRFVPDPEGVGIQHIDCFAKFLDEETVLVQEVPSDHPEYDCYEDVANAFVNATSSTGRPYRVERIFCERYAGDETAAYTNSLFLNGKILVPLFDIAQDAVALQTYRDLLPGYQVIGFPYSAWFYYDALHCRTKEILDPGMLRLQHDRLPDSIPADADQTLEVWIDDRSETGLVPGEQTLHWRVASAPSWQVVPLTPHPGDRFTATLPAQPAGITLEYYFHAADASGREETLPRVAPGGVFSTTTAAVTAVPSWGGPLSISATPTPFNPRTTVRFEVPRDGRYQVTVFDARGRRRATLVDRDYQAGDHELRWRARDDRGAPLPSGVYFLQVRGAGDVVSTKVTLLR